MLENVNKYLPQYNSMRYDLLVSDRSESGVESTLLF